MNGNQPRFYTIVQIANALGVTDEAVRKTLKAIDPSGLVMLSNGGSARGWGFYALPETMRAKLIRKAQENGFESADEYIATNREPWLAPVPFGQVAEKWRNKAFSLQRAFSATLKLTHGGMLGADALKNALADYEKQFGITVTPDYLRRLYLRTIERDRGLKQWHRVELFLDDAAFRKGPCSSPANRQKYSHDELSGILELIEDRQSPSGDDKALFFNAAFAHFNNLCQFNPNEHRAIKRSLLEYINCALPCLSKSAGTLRRMFDDKLNQWRKNGMTQSALEDQRFFNPGRKRPDFSADEKIIADLAVQLEGNESRAQREAYKRGLLSTAYTSHYKLNFRKDKSRVPHVTRRNATDQVIKMEPFHKGPRAVRKAMPRPFRNWDDLNPGDVFEADDLTIPFYWRAMGDAGMEKVIRGECLVFVDRRTGMILDFMMIAGKYNSFDIRFGAGIKIPAKYGKPRDGWLLENGPWRSRLTDGEPIPGAQTLSWRQTHNALIDGGRALESFCGGFEESGMTIKHARPGNPQTKIIEQIFNVTQNRMAAEPGFIGRNERLDGYDRTQSLIKRAEKGEQRSLDKLYTHAEVVRALEVIFSEYNTEPQNGRRLHGASPAEMWREHVSRFPLEKLPDETQFLYASHKKIARPRRDGSFLMEYNGNKRMFFNKETGELSRTEDVIVWWHIEQPNLITVTDIKGRNPFIVKEVVMDSSSATPEDFQRVKQLQKQCMEPGRVRFSNMQNLINTITRDNSQSEATKELGRFNKEAIAEARAEETVAKATRQKNSRRARKLGVNLSDARNEDMAAAGLELLAEAEREMNKENKTEIGL
jgi:hypothetical protein